MSRLLKTLFLLFCLGQSAFGFEQELEFVRGLTEEGFPNLAEKVLDRTLRKFPDTATAAPELRVRILIAQKNFPAAQEKIKTLTDSAPLWLFLAETAYAARQKPVAETAYQNYFDGLSTVDDSTGQAAFNYGELLEERGATSVAKKLYEKTLKLADSRPVKARLASLLVDEDPDRALKLAEDVQLGGLDLWFGQAVVTWARLMVNKEEWDETESVLENQLEILRQISDAVPASSAPVAGARYWLGMCYEHEGKKANALAQFYNVYAKYGDSEWGPKAQEKAQALKKELESQGRTVKIDLGANLAKMEESAFSVARRLFFDRQYADAIPAYIEALNKYPESSDAITALRELTISYIHLNDDVGAKTIGRYLAERFASKPKAGDALLIAGKTALDAKQLPLAWWIYGQAITAFPAHPRVPAVLYSLAGLRKDERYLFQCLENYPDSPYATRSLGRLAWNAYSAEDYKTAAERFAPYVETETDPQKQTRARFAYADSYRNLEQWKKGLAAFQALEKSIKKAADSYGVSKETLAFNEPFLEKSIYYQAICQKERGDIDKAVLLFDRFIEEFPNSGIFEQVRFSKGKMLIENDRFAEALAALDGLDGQFAEPIAYYRGLAQNETGDSAAAIQTLENLLTTWPASAFFFDAQFVLGRAYLAEGRADDAIRTFGDIMNFASDDELLNRASLELGRAQTDPAEKLASFQRVALLADPEKYGDLIAEALTESLPLYLELNRPADLIADADRLLSDFPSIGNAEQIENFKTKAEQLQQEETTNEHE